MTDWTQVPIPSFLDQAVRHSEHLWSRQGTPFAAIAVVLDRGGPLLEEVANNAVMLHAVTDTQVLLVVPARPVKGDPEAYSDPQWSKEDQYRRRLQAARTYSARGDEAVRELRDEITLAVNEVRDYLGVPDHVIPSLLVLCLRAKVALFIASGNMLPLTALFETLGRSYADTSEASLADLLIEIATDAGLDEQVDLGPLKPEAFTDWSAMQLRVKRLPAPGSTSYRM
jgi:hypothetical protein